jgi:hypothetical protein
VKSLTEKEPMYPDKDDMPSFFGTVTDTRIRASAPAGGTTSTGPATLSDLLPEHLPSQRLASPLDPSQCCGIYVRRSNKDAAGSGRDNRSMAEQEEEIRELAARRGLVVVRVFAEREGTGASKKSRKKRPAWDAALRQLADGNDFHTGRVWPG